MFSPPRLASEIGALRYFWIGLILVFSTFALKHTLFSWGVTNVSGVLDIPIKEGERQAARSRAYSAVQAIEEEIDSLSVDSRRGEIQPNQGRIDELTEKRRQTQERAEEEYTRIRKELRRESKEAEREGLEGGLAGLFKLRWMLTLKLGLDLIKLTGAAFILFSALALVAEERAPLPVKVYAMICGAIILIACTIGGLQTMIL